MTYITWIDPILSVGIQELMEDHQEKGTLTYELVETPKHVKGKIEKEYMDPMLCNLCIQVNLPLDQTAAIQGLLQLPFAYLVEGERVVCHN